MDVLVAGGNLSSEWKRVLERLTEITAIDVGLELSDSLAAELSKAS